MPEKHFSGKYKLVKLLNHGDYSKVYHAKDTRTGKSVAIKAVQDYQQGLVEIQALTRLNHRHVINLVEVLATENSSQVFIVTEFAKCGDLFEKVADRRGPLGEDVSRHYFHQLISAVRHCHARGVYHRDIKPENLLLDDKWALKLSDFGLCSVSEPGSVLHDPCGTYEYAAPEVIARRGYDGAKADVWSCGVVLYVLTAGFLPFNGNVGEMWKKMMRGEFKLPSKMSPGLKWLLRRILDPNPETRITIEEILEDGWFRVDWSDDKEEEQIDEEDSRTGALSSY